jgi:hypothetical protein
MFNDRTGNEQGKFPILDQMSQQESVLSPERGRIKYTSLDVRPLSSNGEPSRVQVSNATVRLQHVALEGDEPEVFGPADQTGAIPDESELKAVVLGCVSDRRTKGRQATRLEPAVGVHK